MLQCSNATTSLPYEVEILVNNKPVSVPRETTGRQIKERAKVPDDFELFLIDGDEEIKIEDDEEIKVKKKMRFTASSTLDPS
jgi:hypothetical protein